MFIYLSFIYLYISFFLLAFFFFIFPFPPLSKPPCEGFPGVYEFPWAQQHFKHFFPARAAGKVHSENLGVLCHKTHGKRRESRGREWMCVQSRVWFLDVSLGRIWFKIPDVSSFSMRDSGCRHVCRAAAAPAASAPTEERLASSQNKKKRKGKDRIKIIFKNNCGRKREKGRWKVFEGKIFQCVDSEKQALCWMLNLTLFPENVSSFPSDRAVSWGSKDGRKCCWRNPNPSWRCLCPVPNTTCLYLSHFLPAQPRGGISSHFESLEDEFVHILKMKSSEVLWYQPRGLMQKAESIWRAGRKYIYGNISLAGGCYFPPFFDVWPQ